jgi:hypothetical protein
MDGFASSYAAQNPASQGGGGFIMKCFAPAHVPVLSTLIDEFALFNSWHSSVPGPTMVNRAFFDSATSHGASKNDVLDIILGYPQRTIYQDLDEAGATWRVYFQQIATSWQLQYPRTKLQVCARVSFSDYSVLSANLKNARDSILRECFIPIIPSVFCRQCDECLRLNSTSFLSPCPYSCPSRSHHIHFGRTIASLTISPRTRPPARWPTTRFSIRPISTFSAQARVFKMPDKFSHQTMAQYAQSRLIFHTRTRSVFGSSFSDDLTMSQIERMRNYCLNHLSFRRPIIH